MARPCRPCNRVGCSVLVQPPEQYCPGHRWADRHEKADRDRQYDTCVRNRDAAEFYKSQAWAAARASAMARDYGLCQQCLKERGITAATVVHHKEPVQTAWERRLDLSNLISLCTACHAKMHGRTKKVLQQELVEERACP